MKVLLIAAYYLESPKMFKELGKSIIMDDVDVPGERENWADEVSFPRIFWYGKRTSNHRSG